MKILSVVAVLTLLTIQTIECSIRTMKSNISYVEEKNGFYCHLNEKGNVVQIKVGENYRNTIDCYECFCALSEYSPCAGIGYKAGIVMGPDGCKMQLLQNCKFSFVDKNDETKPCKL